MKRVVPGVVGGYLLVAVDNKVAEAAGAMTCGCAAFQLGGQRCLKGSLEQQTRCHLEGDNRYKYGQTRRDDDRRAALLLCRHDGQARGVGPLSRPIHDLQS